MDILGRKLFFNDCNMKMSLSAEAGEYVKWHVRTKCMNTKIYVMQLTFYHFRTGTTGFLKSIYSGKNSV